MKELLKKIDKVKKGIGKVVKDKENPFYKSRYTDINSLLEQIEPLLEKEGLLLLQPIRDSKVSSVIIDLENGEEYESSMILPELSDPQKMGSAVTYYRRYTLTSLLAIQSEDDDGNLASGKEETQKVATRQKLSSMPKPLNSSMGEKLATAKQISYIKTLGGNAKEGITMAQASKMIEELQK